MATKYEEIKRIPIELCDSDKLKVTIEDNAIVVYKKVDEWANVTNACRLEFRCSQHSNGRYVAILYKPPLGGSPKVAAVIGLNGIAAQSGFKVERAEGAQISFQVFRKG